MAYANSRSPFVACAPRGFFVGPGQPFGSATAVARDEVEETMARPDKAAAVAELSEKFTSSAGIVLTEYRGLTVKALKDLRRSLGDDATYAVSKNTLTTIAAREAGVEGIEEHLVGPTAIAFIDGDPVVVAKGLRDFARTNPLLVIKGGVLDGKFLDSDEVKQAGRSRVARSAARQGRRRHAGRPAAGHLAPCRTALPGCPLAGRPGERGQGEPVAHRRCWCTGARAARSRRTKNWRPTRKTRPSRAPPTWPRLMPWPNQQHPLQPEDAAPAAEDN